MEHWNRLSPQHPCLSFFFFSFSFFLAQPQFLSSPAFDCSVEFWQCLVSVILLFTCHSLSFVCWFAGGIMQWEIIYSCVATNRNVDLMLHWDCLRCCARCTVYTPAVLSSSFYACLSVTMQGRLLSWAHTHTHTHTLSLYYIMRTLKILCQNYIIALGP